MNCRTCYSSLSQYIAIHGFSIFDFVKFSNDQFCQNTSSKILFSLFAECVSFSYKFKTLRSGNSYDSRTRLEISAHEDEVTGEVEVYAREDNEQNGVRFSLDSDGERIKASRTSFALCLQARRKILKKLLVRAKFKYKNDSRMFVTETKVSNNCVSVKHLHEILWKFWNITTLI